MPHSILPNILLVWDAVLAPLEIVGSAGSGANAAQVGCNVSSDLNDWGTARSRCAD